MRLSLAFINEKEKKAIYVEKSNIIEMELLSAKNQQAFSLFSKMQADPSLIQFFQEFMPDLGIQTQAIKGISFVPNNKI